MNLLDSFGRKHTYLRISVTDRCNFRCVYCLPENGVQWTSKSDILSYEEIAHLVHVFAQLGIQKIRLTGGEPTMRADICTLVASLCQIQGIQEVNMTTNGYTLPKMAQPLHEAGLRKLNISLDTLDKDTFHKMSKGFSIDPVLRGIEKALALGFSLKINAVILKGINENSIIPLLHFCSLRNIELRFIEYMPFEARWHQCVTSKEIRTYLSKRYTLSALSSHSLSGPSQTYWVSEKKMRVGFISPLSNRFCDSCNRLRLSCKGELRTCLAHEEAPSLGTLLRNNATDTELKLQIQRQVFGKKEGHFCEVEAGTPFQGVMTQIGG